MKKKSLISSLTVAGFLAAGMIPMSGTLAIAADQPAKKDMTQDAAQKDMAGKKGACSGSGGCSAAKKKDTKEMKEGSCTAMKKKPDDKAGSCTAMKK